MDTTIEALRAAADPTRLRILCLLESGELTVSELVTILGQSQPRISRHLKILVDAQLLVRHREGSWVFHRLPAKTGPASTARQLVSLVPKDDPLRRQDHERLSEIQITRAQLAENYFAKNFGEDPEFQAQDIDTQGRVRSNFLSTIQPQTIEPVVEPVPSPTITPVRGVEDRTVSALRPRPEEALGRITTPEAPEERSVLETAGAGCREAGDAD